MPNNSIGNNIKRTIGKRIKEHSEHAPLNLTSNSVPVKIGTRTAKYYERGLMPTAHKLLYDALREALNGADEGEVNMEEILHSLEMYRSSALRIMDILQHYGYIEREPRVRCTWIHILK